MTRVAVPDANCSLPNASANTPGTALGSLQFSLKALLCLATVVAFYLALVRSTGWYMVIPPMALAAIWYFRSCLAEEFFPMSKVAVARTPAEINSRKSKAAALLSTHAVWLAVFATFQWPYYLYGAVTGGGYIMLSVVVLLGFSNLAVIPYRRFSNCLCLVAIAMSFSWFLYFALLWNRHLDVQQEVRRIAAWARIQRASSGTVPQDLSEYRFARPDLAECIEYSQLDTQAFYVRFRHVPPGNIEHYYSSTRDEWGFLDD